MSASVPSDVVLRRKGLFALFSCLVVATIGFGITLPILPFYAERLALRGPANSGDAAAQVGLLTAVYPLIQIPFAPLWGYWSDRVGRKRLLLIGIGGASISQVLFGVSTSLPGLYIARFFGGIASAAIFPAAAAYVADSTDEQERARGMAWLGTALSLGVVVGPAFGAALARMRGNASSTASADFAIPFFAAALLGLVATFAVIVWVPASERSPGPAPRTQRRALMQSLVPPAPIRALLGLTLAAQFGLALFESTFALYAKRMWNYGPSEVGSAFIVCGLVMSIAQSGGVALMTRRYLELPQIATGFALVSVSLGVMPMMQTRASMLASVAALALGVALISPNVAALLSIKLRSQSGAAFGVQSAASSFGQFAGTIAGGFLLGWQMEAPFRLASATLFGVALVVVWWALTEASTRVALGRSRDP